MQCRKALEETDGDMDKSLIILRKKGAEIAQKKSDRSAVDGTITVKTDGKRALTLILNCETDFVAKNADFVALAQKLADIAWESGVEKARQEAPALINDVVLKIGENIQLGPIDEIAGNTIGVYTHHTAKMAAVVSLTGGTVDTAKDIAMHVAAMRPSFLSSDEITDEIKASVMEILEKEVAESDKPEDIKQKMLAGKLDAYFKEQTLLDQPFFKLPEKTIRAYAAEAGATIDKFVIYSV